MLVSARELHGRPRARYRAVVARAFRALPLLVGLGLLPLVIYLVVALPLTGLGLGLSVLDGLAVPQFIMTSILQTPAWARVTQSTLTTGWA